MFRAIGKGISIGVGVSVVTEEESEMTVEGVTTTGVSAKVGIMEGEAGSLTSATGAECERLR